MDVFQLRDKKGSDRSIIDFIRKALRTIKGRCPFLINDRVDLALASRCDGVHLGQEDLPVATARQMLGPRAIIGVSCQDLKAVDEANKAGADYIGFGSVFKTATKPERSEMDLNLLKKAAARSSIPLFAIGGITLENLGLVKAAGVKRIAVCRAICLADDDFLAAKKFQQILNSP